MAVKYLVKEGVKEVHQRQQKGIIVSLLVFFSLTLMPVQAMASDYGPWLMSWGSRGNYVQTLQKDLSSLGYSTYGADGIFGANTDKAVRNFQAAQHLRVDGIVGAATKAALNQKLSTVYYKVKSGDTLSAIAARYGVTVQAIMQANGLKSTLIYAGSTLKIPSANTGSSVQPPSRGGSRTGVMADWWTVVNNAFPRGAVATVTDVDSGITYRVKRTGGSNHADCQPLTAADTANMKKAHGGSWSWTRRAIVVTVNGKSYAASQNCMPHGNQSIYDNNFPGHFCIHFLNSRTHGTNRVDAAHQAMVRKAAGR